MENNYINTTNSIIEDLEERLNTAFTDEEKVEILDKIAINLVRWSCD